MIVQPWAQTDSLLCAAAARRLAHVPVITVAGTLRKWRRIRLITPKASTMPVAALFSARRRRFHCSLHLRDSHKLLMVGQNEG
jgi:hypothetical protein